MVSPFAADDDHDAAFASTEDAVTPSDDDETVGPRSEVVHDDVDVDEGVIPEDDVKVIAPARPVPTHLRALPPVEPPTAASQIPRLRDGGMDVVPFADICRGNELPQRLVNLVLADKSDAVLFEERRVKERSRNFHR